MKKFFVKRVEVKPSTSTQKKETVTRVTNYAPAPMSRTVKLPFCKCSEDDLDLVEDECDSTRGCGKPLSFCGECFKLIKLKDIDQCSCANTQKKLENAKQGLYDSM